MSPVPLSADELVTLGATAATRNGVTTWWFADPSDELAAMLAARGITPDRRLHQMRVDLPVAGVEAAPTRGYGGGADAAGVLAVNNAAFATHPDQGGWTETDLALRMSESWFDPEGLRILDLGGTGAVDGFCWMKPHGGAPPMGEIHVIALAPRLHGRGLGAALAAAGLEWVARRHGVAVGMLYVESDNDAALSTYGRLGFTVHHTDLGVIGPDPD